eukprot:6491106-Amphidinium_carterae.2
MPIPLLVYNPSSKLWGNSSVFPCFKLRHQPKRADCPVCQQADGVRVAHKTASDEHKAMRARTMYLDVGHMHAADSSGRKSWYFRGLNQSPLQTALRL